MAILAQPLTAIAMITYFNRLARTASAFHGPLRGGAPALQVLAQRGHQQPPRYDNLYRHHHTCSHHVARNRYARLRRRLSAADDISSPQLIAQATMSVLTRKGKTWKRLGDMVELACGCDTHAHTDSTSTIADIGTDHGMLSIALAATVRYKKVIGVDVSEQALENGARSFHRKVLDVLSRDESIDDGTIGTEESILPVEFRAGYGLSVLDEGEADAVAISGMGINTMLKILLDEELRRVGTRQLFLQPTNSRPRNLISLYDHLQYHGWSLREEYIKYIAMRWYISASFDRLESQSYTSSNNLELPGDMLRMLARDDPMNEEHLRYVDHHRQWLERDLAVKGSLEEQDARWFDAYCNPQ